MDYFEHMQLRLQGKESHVPARIGDKKLIRQFCDLIGVRTPAVHFRGLQRDLRTFDFPSEFVLKPAFASTSIGVMLLARDEGATFKNLINGDIIHLDTILETCKDIASRYYDDPGVGDFIVEELLRDENGSTPPQDIRFYAFQGEIGMILKEDHLSGSAAQAMYFDGEFLPFPDVKHRYSVAEKAKQLEAIVEAKTPTNWKQLLEVAKRVSTAVPTAFCRVDLYDTPTGVVLGEVTFFPGTFYYRDRKIMSQSEAERLGRMWDEAADRLSGSL
ncbi:ATP-grasp fold amidoligase family protein [Arthrobacter citreus]|uniref:ATP-grasp fold amidoligase family protein n=1 Tax=Arthrobacter citreus TaxID=1670 RepID=A0ABZ2ZZR9_9MICC